MQNVTKVLNQQFHLRSLMIALMASPLFAHAACTDNLDGTFTCANTSSNADIAGGNMTGAVTLDNASGPVTLDNLNGGAIGNNAGAATVGVTNTIQTNGSADVNINNTISNIFVDRSSSPYATDPNAITATNPNGYLFSVDGAGHLLNGATPAGVAAAIYSDARTNSLTINLLDGFDPNQNFAGMIRADDPNIGNPSDFSAAIYGSARNITINSNGFIFNSGFSGNADSLAEGHWAIATYGTGTTTLNMSEINAIDSNILIGDILMIDRNPLMVAAQRLDPSLVLAYGADDVGVRNSVINLGKMDDPNVVAHLTGNVYLGSGTHTINIGGGGIFQGNIYIDQSSVNTTDANGTVLSTVAGARRFTLNNFGQMDTSAYSINLNDVAGAVNVMNFRLGYFYSSLGATSNESNIAIHANGLGDNTVNATCYYGAQGQSSGLCGVSNLTGITTLNLDGTRFQLGSDIQVSGNVNLNAQEIRLNANAVVNAGSVNIAHGSTLSGDTGSNSSVIGSIQGNLVNNGTIDLGTATLNVSGNASFNAGAHLLTTLGANGNGKIVLGGAGNFASNAVIVPTVSGASLLNGQSFLIATHTTGSPTVVNGTGLFQWTTSDVTGDLLLVANIGVPKFLIPTTSASAINVANYLANYAGAGGNSDLLKLNSELMLLEGVEVKRNIERLRPEIHDGAFRMVQGNTDRMLGIIESHLFDTQLASILGDQNTLVATFSGDQIKVAALGSVSLPTTNKPSGAGIWVQGYGFGGTQERNATYDGYSATSTGMVFGADRKFGDADNLRVGGAFGYARGNVDNSGYTSVNRMNINSYMGTIYAAWAAQPWYVNGSLSVGRHTYDTQRMALSRLAEGQHDAWQFSARADAGWPLAVNDNLTLVPVASLDYHLLDEAGYDEHGSIIALHLDHRRTESYRSGLGGKILLSLQEEDWNAGIELRVLYQHEFGNVAQDSVARFVVGGVSLNSPGVKPQRDTAVLGSSIRLTGDDRNDQLSMLVSYDAEMRSQYFGQTLSMMLRYDFDQGPSYQKRAEARKAAIQTKNDTMPSLKITEHDLATIQQAITPNTTSFNPDDLRQQQAISTTLDGWVNAMVNHNVDVYFNNYAAEFSTADGSSRQSWERQRKLEFGRLGKPIIKIADLTIKPEGAHATAVFTQTVAMGDSKEVMIKSLKLVDQQGQWKIVREDGMAVPE